jgi:NADH-quinone oxidoreductase subunit J
VNDGALMNDVGISIAFWVLGLSTVVAALFVVTLRNILHAALALIVSFFAIAGLYITLRADFLALVQVLVYVGAIAILILFGIMLTRNAAQGNQGNRISFPAGLLALLVLGAVVYIVAGLSSWGQTAPVSTDQLASIASIADLLFNIWIVPFVLIAVLLLAAMIGAIVLTKEGRPD